MVKKAKWTLIKLKIPNLLTEVTTSPDASLSGSSAPLAQLTIKLNIKNWSEGKGFQFIKEQISKLIKVTLLIGN